MQEFIFTVNAIFPMIILITLGYFLKIKNIFTESIVKGLNSFIFIIAIPVLIFYNIYNMETFSVDLNVALFMSLTIIFLFIVGVLFTNKVNTKKENKSILLQTFFRTNATTLGLQVVLLMNITQKAEANVIAMTGISIALYNALGVIAFQIYDTNKNKINYYHVFLKVLKNPIIIAIILGFIFKLTGQFLEVSYLKDNLNWLYKAIGQVAAIASPLALITLGASFSFKSLKELKKEIILGVLIRSLIVPTIIFLIAIIFRNEIGFDKNHFPALISVLVPSFAITVVPMADSMNGNSKLAAQIVVWTTIFSTFTMFIIIFILKSMGLV